MANTLEESLSNRAASLGLPIEQPPTQEARPKSRMETELEGRAERLGIPVDKLREYDREALRKSGHLNADCLGPEGLSDAGALAIAQMAHVLSCPMCAALVEVQHEINENQKNPLVVDFKPSVVWISELATALRAVDLPGTPERLECVRDRIGGEVVKYIATSAYTARSSQTLSFTIIENGEFSKCAARERLDGAVLIPPTTLGEQVRTALAKEFVIWMAQRCNDLEVGHRILDRIVVESDKVIGFVVLERAIRWPLHC